MSIINISFIEKLSNIYNKEDFELCVNAFKIEKRKTCFRVNTLKTNNSEIEKILKENNIWFQKVDFLENTYFLEKKFTEKDLWNLDIFEKWFIYLQSLSSQLPVSVLDLQNWDKVLDITAAPGWKTSQAAAIMKNTWEIIANDNNAIRIDKLDFTLKRQGVKNVKTIKNDARKIWEFNPDFSEYFDKIIADLPCSAEWKFNEKIEKSHAYWSQLVVNKNYKLQKQIIQNTIPLLKKWWELVYSTCTISPEENEAICHMIMCNFSEMEIVDININYKYSRNWIKNFENKIFKNEIEKSIRILPSEETEWFFIAKFKKK